MLPGSAGVSPATAPEKKGSLPFKWLLAPMILKCPRCGKETERTGNPYRPFCSERCKMIDLGNWISGVYRISRKSEDEDEDGESPPRKDSEKE